MSKANNHIICKQHVSINFEDIEARMGMQDDIATVFKEQLQPRMEKLFDELADEGHRIKLEQLEIDCGVLSKNNWEQDLVDTTIAKLKAALITANRTSIKKDVFWEDFFYFLKHGLLPWNSRVKALEEFETTTSFDNLFFSVLEDSLDDEQMVMRLLNQFSDGFTTAFVKSLVYRYENKMKTVRAFSALIQQATIMREQKEAVLKTFINELQTTSMEDERGVELKTKELSNNKEVVDLKEIYVSNAGLVLLHPFLPKLFENLQLINKQQWINEEAQQIALAVTVFLVTGETQLAEFDLPFNKIICGLPASGVINKLMPLTAEQQQECEELLEQVIKMWSQLKNTGIAAFREIFLQRTGKLTRCGNGYMLQVEPKAFDVLLNTLPWGIGIIKMPWMKEIIYTEWM